MELQTMPLRFRIWDDIEKYWGAIPSHHINIWQDHELLEDKNIDRS